MGGGLKSRGGNGMPGASALARSRLRLRGGCIPWCKPTARRTAPLASAPPPAARRPRRAAARRSGAAKGGGGCARRSLAGGRDDVRKRHTGVVLDGGHGLELGVHALHLLVFDRVRPGLTAQGARRGGGRGCLAKERSERALSLARAGSARCAAAGAPESRAMRGSRWVAGGRLAPLLPAYR